VIRKLSSQPKYQNPWLSVREDQVEFENGHQGIYGVVEKSDFVVVIPFDGEHFFLVQQYRYPIEQELLEFPQGKHEDNPSEDPLSLASAELEEETGLRAENLEHLGIFHPAPGHMKQIGHVYLATKLVQEEQKLDPTEADLRVHKVTPAELHELVTENKITDGSSLVAYNFLQNTRFRNT
jgi:ADP-ribose pyrophosphatase